MTNKKENGASQLTIFQAMFASASGFSNTEDITGIFTRPTYPGENNIKVMQTCLSMGGKTIALNCDIENLVKVFVAMGGEIKPETPVTYVVEQRRVKFSDLVTSIDK